jgi:hypothetical protein
MAIRQNNRHYPAFHTILLTADRQQETSLFNRFQPLDVGVVNLLKLLELAQVDSDFR